MSLAQRRVWLSPHRLASSLSPVSGAVGEPGDPGPWRPVVPAAQLCRASSLLELERQAKPTAWRGRLAGGLEKGHRRFSGRVRARRRDAALSGCWRGWAGRFRQSRGRFHSATRHPVLAEAWGSVSTSGSSLGRWALSRPVLQAPLPLRAPGRGSPRGGNPGGGVQCSWPSGWRTAGREELQHPGGRGL